MNTIAKARENKSVVTSPEKILSLLDRTLEGERLCLAESNLPATGENSSSVNVVKIREAVGTVEKKIRYLVEGISSAGLLMYHSSRVNNKNFDYNLLSSYVSIFAVKK